MSDLAALFGPIDIYLFDQLLRGRILPGDRIVDAGCGAGRNLTWLLREACEVYGVDADRRAIAAVRELAAAIAPSLSPDHFRVGTVEAMDFPDAFADVVLSSAVLHFARDTQHFDAMVDEMWRILRRGGLLFARVASTIGMADRMQPLGRGRYHLPDGSERYLVDEAQLMACTARVGGRLLDPLKTTVVQDQRCMTTWVVRK
jgi:tellurite methyltransferase